MCGREGLGTRWEGGAGNEGGGRGWERGWGRGWERG